MKKRSFKVTFTALMVLTFMMVNMIPAYAMSTTGLAFSEPAFELFGVEITPVMLMIALIVILIVACSWLSSSREYYKKQYALYKDLYDESSSSYDKLNEQYYTEKFRADDFETWKAEVLEVYPDADRQVSELRAAKEGMAFLKKYEVEIPLQYLQMMIEDFEELPEDARKYANFDPETAKKNLNILQTKED